jgi:hypothetical protein
MGFGINYFLEAHAGQWQSIDSPASFLCALEQARRLCYALPVSGFNLKAISDSNKSSVAFCPAQKRANEHLLTELEIGSILRLLGGAWRGNTTVLRPCR